MSFIIVTDSSANLPDDIIEQNDINILSLSFRVGNKEFRSYKKGEKTNLQQFYTMMRQKQAITTSCVSPQQCAECLEDDVKQGKDVLFIGFSSALSGTYQAVCTGFEQLREKYPQGSFYTVDTLSASLGQGLLVLYAAQMRAAGKTAKEVHEWLLENCKKMCALFTVNDLFFLMRGGRVDSSSAVLGTVFSIKPILHVDDEGRLINIDKVRGRKNSIKDLVDKMAVRISAPEEQIIGISHGDCEEEALYLKELILEKYKVKDVIINFVDPVIGAHAGPGTLALFFLGSPR